MSAFIVWAVVAASLAFWGLRIFVRAAPVPPYATAVSTAQTARGDIVRLFADPQAASPVMAQPALASRFRLIGVMAPKPGERVGAQGAGLALIAIDDKPPRAFAIGARLDNDLVLQTVSLRSAAIGPAKGAAAVVLELPPLPPPATGALPAQGAPGATGLSMPPNTPPPAPVPPMPEAQAMPPNYGSQLPPAVAPSEPAASADAMPPNISRPRQR